MPKIRFTALTVEKLKPPQEGRSEYFDELVTGLHLRITTRGKKTWNLSYRYNKKSKRMLLGSFPITTLSDAREKARAALKVLEMGNDPAELKKQDEIDRQEHTVNNVISLFIERHAKPKNRTWWQAECYLRNSVGKVWGDRPLKDINRREVNAYFDSMIDEGKTYSVNNIFRNFRSMCNWAAAREIIDDSPCRYVKLPYSPESRDRVMEEKEIQRFWSACEDLGYPFGKCFQMLMLTGQRRSEVAEMTWDEVDLEKGIWRIAKERCKNGRAHEVPLSSAAIELLRSMPCYKPQPYIFSTWGGIRPIQGFDKVKKDVELAAKLENWRIHDIRRSVATHISSLGIPRFTIQKILNHVDRSVTGIYDRNSYLKEKNEALQLWANHLEKLTKEETKAQA